MSSYMNAVLKWIAETKQGPTKAARYVFLAAGVMMFTMCSLFGLPFEVDKQSAVHVSETPADKYAVFTNVVTPVLSSFFPGSQMPAAQPIDPRWNGLVQILADQANAFLSNRANDGSSATIPIVKPNGDRFIVPGEPLTEPLPEPLKWTPLKVNGGVQEFLTPQWGYVDGIVSDDQAFKLYTMANTIMPSPAQRERELEEITSLQYSNRERMIAELWAGGPGTVTPPGTWVLIAIKAVDSLGFEWNRTVSVLFLLTSALFQSSITAWRIKRDTLQQRPIQAIMQQPDRDLKSWNGVVKSSRWVPYQEQNFVTPPFSDFVSGHSTFSGAASFVLEKCLNHISPQAAALTFTKDELLLLSPIFRNSSLFDEDICRVGCFVMTKNISNIDMEYPFTTFMLTYDSWLDMAQECGMSRIYGGIHTQSANAGGLLVGQSIGQIVLEKFPLFS